MIHNGLRPSSTVPSRIDAPRPTGLHSVNCTFVHSLDLTLYACTFIRLSGLTLVLTLTVIKCQFFILSGSLHDLWPCVCACYSHVMSSSNLTRSSISRAGVIFQDHLSRPLFNISGQSVSQPGPQYPCGRELSRQKSTYPGYPGIPIYYRPAQLVATHVGTIEESDWAILNI